jgi:hypothetical protein
MKRYTLLLLLTTILLSACSPQTNTPAVPSYTATPTLRANQPGISTASSTPTVGTDPGVRPSPTTTPQPSPSPVPLDIAQGNGLDHDPIFIIYNEGRYSGEAGQAPWLAWGADNLAVAPDGSFWIADTPADPDRLLHYSTQGDLLLELPLRFGERTFWGRDLAVDSTGVWVLDYLSQPSVVLQISTEGNLLASYEIPAEFDTFDQASTVIPGLWRIPFVENGRVTLDGPAGIVELTIQDGSPAFTKVTGYTLDGITYTDVQDGLMVDSLRVGMQFLQPDHFLNHAWLLGAASDGSFYVREDEGNNDQGLGEPTDEFVRRYSGNGTLLGIALLPLPELHQPNDVALGQDGNVYTLRSRPDHSVEILRLRFSNGPAPLLPPHTTTIQVAFAPLLPSGDPPKDALEAARQAMLTFFTALADGRYEDAAALYGGSYEEAIAQDPGISADQPTQAWMSICTSEFCLPVSDILDSRALAADEFEFLVGFAGQNGFRFDYSICCGYFSPTPLVSFFVYSVKVERVEDQWKVMGGPAPLP